MRFDNTNNYKQLLKMWRNLPVFRITGGNRKDRESFVAWLQERCRLEKLVLVRISGPMSSHALVQLVLRSDLVVLDKEVETSFPVEHVLHLNAARDQEVMQKHSELWVNWKAEDPSGHGDIWKNISARLARLATDMPVWACILIGGKSSRMGTPKHLIKNVRGKTWIESLVDTVAPAVEGIAISGTGNVPNGLHDLPRLPDIPGVVGPVNGIIAALRWQPLVSWLVLACDMPHVSKDAVTWLLAERRVGRWAEIPKLAGEVHCEPLFAWYDIRSASLFED